MNYYIAVDCEGVACAVGTRGAPLNESRDLAFAREQASREADAAARALFDSGSQRVIVWDAHSGGLNLHYLQLDRRCEIALGAPFPHRCPGMDESFGGLLFIGYHAMAGTPEAVMAHTMSSTLYEWVRVNGEAVGEMAIDAAVAGERGVPPIFVASDDKGVAEAERFFPGITTVATKTALSYNAAVSRHPLGILDEIYEGVRRAVAAPRPAIYRFPSPLRFERRYRREEDVQKAGEEWERVDELTVRKTLSSIEELY